MATLRPLYQPSLMMGVVEPCLTYFVRRDREQKKLVLRLEPGKCLHYYFYFLHEQLGLLHLRLQTWFPFALHLLSRTHKSVIRFGSIRLRRLFFRIALKNRHTHYFPSCSRCLCGTNVRARRPKAHAGFVRSP